MTPSVQKYCKKLLSESMIDQQISERVNVDIDFFMLHKYCLTWKTPKISPSFFFYFSLIFYLYFFIFLHKNFNYFTVQFPQTLKFCGNELKVLLFVVILTARLIQTNTNFKKFHDL